MTMASRAPHYPQPDPKALARAVAYATLAAYHASLVGDPARVTREVCEALTRPPRKGDLALEISSRDRPEWPGNALGRVLFVANVKPRTEEDWIEATEAGEFKMDSTRGYGPYVYLDPLDGSQRACWENAAFLVVPERRVA
jgi:hypothetical protein